MDNVIDTCLGPTMGPTIGHHAMAATSKACTLPFPKKVQGNTELDECHESCTLGFADYW